MSGLLAGKVWQSDLSSDLKPLTACLADQANDRGDGIYSSIAYLAWKLSTSERTVQRGMRRLREMQVIVQVGFKKMRERVSVPLYRLVVSNLPERPPWRFQQGDTDGVTPVSPRGDDGVTKTRDGVTSTVRRGDTAMSPKPLEEPLERNVKEEAAASVAYPVEIVRAFEELGCKPFGHPEFQQAWTMAFSEAVAARQDPVWSDVMETAIARCSDLGVGVPRKFYLHKREVEKREIEALYRRTPL
jgi:hypothetical protein